MTIRRHIAGTVALLAVATAHGASHTAAEMPGGTEVEATATAEVADAYGEPLGTVRFAATPSGQMHLIWQLTGIAPGVHGIHVHQTGDCSAGDFASAGGHRALGPGRLHQPAGGGCR